MLDNNFTSSLLIFILIIYTGLFASNLPDHITKIFENEQFKLLIIFMIIYMSTFNPMVSLLIAVGYALSLQSQTKNELYSKLVKLISSDTFTDTDKKVSFNDIPQVINIDNTEKLNDYYKLNTNTDIYNMNNNISNDNNYQWDYYANDYNYANF